MKKIYFADKTTNQIVSEIKALNELTTVLDTLKKTIINSLNLNRNDLYKFGAVLASLLSFIKETEALPKNKECFTAYTQGYPQKLWINNFQY